MISWTSCILLLSNRNPWVIKLTHILLFMNHESNKFQSFQEKTAWQYNSQYGPDHMSGAG